MKQTIAIIGATGRTGAILAQSLVRQSYRLLLFSHHKEQLDKLSEQLIQLNASADFEGMGCAVDACWEADLIIVAVPNQEKKEAAQKIRQVATQKIVLDIVRSLDHSEGPGQDLRDLLPYSKVIEVLITDHARQFEQPVQAFIAGSDQEALQQVDELLRTSGLHTIINRFLPVIEQ